MLERMGQKKVSLLVESVDDWALGGLQIAREPTTVGAPKSAQDLAVPATTYRAGAVTSKSASPYPVVYIAAGSQAPARAPKGAADGAKVVHLPYTDLLDGNGLPKPAKDLWNLLEKTGVPRYAQIVVFSEQVGEAAANLFVFRLMGFSDVKVWVPE
jgi:3-mercaptopyruvate sulfurtransferase SseA